MYGPVPACGNDLRTAVQKLDHVGNVKDVLVESGEEENLVALERAADGASDLLLAVVRLEREKRIGRAERTIAQIVERCAVHVIRAGFRHHVDDRAARASLLGAVGIRRDAKLLHHFGGEMIGRAITSARLRKECIVVVAAVDQEAVLKSANAAEGKIAVGGRGQAARILRDAGGEQREI